jgi:SulP family sulfate permease
MLVPKLVTCLKTYDREQLIKDIISGIIVAIIALPLAIALAIASGVTPEKGLLTAIIGGFIVSLFGGSRVQIGGPTGAFVIIVFGIVQVHGLDGLMIATLMAGVFLVLMGVFKFGGLLKYIPSPIITGFTSGIAVVIFSTQIKDFFGLQMNEVPAEFVTKWVAYFQHMPSMSFQSLFIGALTMGIILLWPKISRKIPGTFIAIIVATVTVIALKLNVETIGSQFGDLAVAWPTLTIPVLNLQIIKDLMLPALTIAILAGVESLLSAVVADGMIGGKHRSNMELVAQGLANIASAIFGGIPVTGAIARTAANVKNGGRTPIAGIVHAVTLLLIMLIFMPYVKFIPMATLASVLIIVAYNMGEWEAFTRLNKAPKSDVFVFLLTFFLTIFVDLVVAIGVGVILSSFLFMRRMAEISDVKYILNGMEDDDYDEILNKVNFPDQVAFYEISGPFFFGAANKFVSAIREMNIPAQILVIKMAQVPIIDSTAYHSLQLLHDLCTKHHTKLILLQLKEQPMKMLTKYGFVKELGIDNFCTSVETAIARANVLMGEGR